MALVSYSLLQLLNARGEDEVSDVLSSFRCERNKDIEDFVRYNTFDFNLRGFCASYLVFDTDAAALVGFYALALKIASIPENVVSKTAHKKLASFGELRPETGCFDLPCVLLAQFGKSDSGIGRVTGEELMAFVEKSISDIQRLVGGRFVFLDSVNEPGLIEYYSRMGYREFGIRNKPAGEDSDSAEGSYVQMFKYLHL